MAITILHCRYIILLLLFGLNPAYRANGYNLARSEPIPPCQFEVVANDGGIISRKTLSGEIGEEFALGECSDPTDGDDVTVFCRHKSRCVVNSRGDEVLKWCLQGGADDSGSENVEISVEMANRYDLELWTTDGAFLKIVTAYGPVGETFRMSGCSTETQGSAACSQAGDASGVKMVKNSRGEEIGEGNCCVDAGLEISTVRMEDFSEECRSVEFTTRTGVWSRLEWPPSWKWSRRYALLGGKGRCPQNVPHVELSRDECHAANREMELSGGVGYVIGIDNSWLQHGCFRVFSGKYQVYFNAATDPPIFMLHVSKVGGRSSTYMRGNSTYAPTYLPEASELMHGRDSVVRTQTFEAVCRASQEYYAATVEKKSSSCNGYKAHDCGLSVPCYHQKSMLKADGMPISIGSIAHDLCCGAHPEGHGCRSGGVESTGEECAAEWESAEASAREGIIPLRRNRSGEWCGVTPGKFATVDVSEKMSQPRVMHFGDYSYVWQQGNFPLPWTEMCAPIHQIFLVGGQAEHAADYCCSGTYDAGRGCVMEDGGFCRADDGCVQESVCRVKKCRKWPFARGQTCEQNSDCANNLPCCRGKCRPQENKCRLVTFWGACWLPYTGCTD